MLQGFFPEEYPMSLWGYEDLPLTAEMPSIGCPKVLVKKILMYLSCTARSRAAKDLWHSSKIIRADEKNTRFI